MAIIKDGKDDVDYDDDCDGSVDCGHCRPMLVVAKMMAKVILVVISNTCYLCQKFWTHSYWIAQRCPAEIPFNEGYERSKNPAN